jgi:NAD(P)-dependent dehydrogenase (short-subunit alcohol dehydrogenase family)
MLKNKGIVVIGGTTGIGLSAAKAFIEQGAGIVVVGRNQTNYEKAQQILGNNAVVIPGDATDESIAPDAIEACIKKFGGFTGLYHVAGGSGRSAGDGPLHELSMNGWVKTLEMNLTSLMISNRAAVRAFFRQGSGGTILNMGSVLGTSPSPEYFATHAYAAAKSAVIGFSLSVASYYASVNIRVNVIAPALVETPMAERAAQDHKILEYIKTKQPLDGGRIGSPEDLDGAACFFMSDQSSFITGQVMAVDGGWSLSDGQYPH